jgi:hypothetical protein
MHRRYRFLVGEDALVVATEAGPLRQTSLATTSE